ncbi:thioredoxin family protein [Candidatus Parcubacteria bacterium]|uniref:Thioredoxin domain-containing protein n=1 Tax=Candidatus Kaiserbacteria bacterium CG10_big_fil_rev_8_21_14_0_10_47_16 TaxID=1974608 RepID=A0A2H0UFA9_9BACT|nr:thioredoxin family protein [Candidatus Parcubacteria bacterium]PIR84356.1 MAG: hypothetical protein COU16_02060 [Candidatus Kaiserbacteria bacterium CG10_big_fil_rev_8_21_14_0_10_47_16]
MNTTQTVILIIVLIVIGISSYAFLKNDSNDAMMDDGTMMQDDSTMEDTSMKDDTVMEGDAIMSDHGSYEAYSPEKLAKADNGDVILFFRASWCPTCRALDADIKSHRSDIPAGVTILDVDYDNSTALKQKYGVTYQHTLVQVDAQGNMITKWSSSPTLTSLLTNVI